MPSSTTPADIVLDVRALFAPEPMERVLDALASLQVGQQIRMLIEREPYPLYRILDQNNYRYACTEPEPGLFQIVIAER